MTSIRVSRQCWSRHGPLGSASGWELPCRLPSLCQPSLQSVIPRGSISISRLSQGLVNPTSCVAVFTGDQRKGPRDMGKGSSEPQGGGLGSTMNLIYSSLTEESGHLTHFPCYWPWSGVHAGGGGKGGHSSPWSLKGMHVGHPALAQPCLSLSEPVLGHIRKPRIWAS